MTNTQERGQETQSEQQAMSSMPEPAQATETGSGTRKSQKRLRGIICKHRKRLTGMIAAISACAVFVVNLNTIMSFAASIVHVTEVNFTKTCTAQTPINFDAPPAKEPLAVGQYADAYGIDKWSKSNGLYLFVFANDINSKEVFYPTTRLKLNGNSWVFNQIQLGRPSDNGMLYPIDLVLVNQSANKIIQAYMRTHGAGNGMESLPAGASIVASVVASRVC